MYHVERLYVIRNSNPFLHGGGTKHSMQKGPLTAAKSQENVVTRVKVLRIEWIYYSESCQDPSLHLVAQRTLALEYSISHISSRPSRWKHDIHVPSYTYDLQACNSLIQAGQSPWGGCGVTHNTAMVGLRQKYNKMTISEKGLSSQILAVLSAWMTAICL
jgi:hypothetical protein